MSEKRSQTTTLAEMMAALPPARDSYGRGIPSPAGREEFVDDTGQRWRKVRGPLQRNLAKRLALQADEMIIGEGGGGHFRHVPSTGRATTWHAIKNLLGATCTPSYRPYEFASGDGRTLLYVEESC
ncbi:hypothetical protein [Kitasatospora sp. NPDC088351]|uniref:hypothetical protein n=1 Tax=unclassified Kitasatospora TaxID=2633591 RepID=UPI003418183C